jgi:hypothetical protein
MDLEEKFGRFYKLSDIAKLTKQDRSIVEYDWKVRKLLPTPAIFGKGRNARWTDEDIQIYLERARKQGEEKTLFVRKGR